MWITHQKWNNPGVSHLLSYRLGSYDPGSASIQIIKANWSMKDSRLITTEESALWKWKFTDCEHCFLPWEHVTKLLPSSKVVNHVLHQPIVTKVVFLNNQTNLKSDRRVQYHPEVSFVLVRFRWQHRVWNLIGQKI